MILCGGTGWGGVDLAKDKPRLSSQGQTKVLTQRENPGASRTLHFSPDNMALPRAGSTPWPPEGLSTSAPARRPSSCRHARGIRISGKTQPGRALPVSARVTSSGVSSSLSYKGIAVVKMLFNCGSGGREEKPGGKGRQWVCKFLTRMELFWSQLRGGSDWFSSVPFLGVVRRPFAGGWCLGTELSYSKYLSTKLRVSKDLLLI